MKDFFVKIIKSPFVINLVVLAVVTCCLIYGVLKWLDHYTLHNQAVIVPDVKGLSLEEASVFIHNSGLRYNVIDSVFSKDVSPGSVVELVPSAGSKVKENRIVFVTINAVTAQMADIPEVEDLSFRQAYALLKSRGFTTIETKYVPGLYKDLAIAVESEGRTLQSGEKVTLTTPLVLVVSSGMEEIPDSLDTVENEPRIEQLDSEVERWF